MNILPQITQITQRNAASCIISQRNSKNCIPLCGNCLSLRKSAASALADIFALTVFRLRDLRDLRENTGVSFEQYRLSTLACYSLADHAEDAEECSKLHYFAEKD